MNVNRSSWHYKISNLGEFEKRNDNLCNYFWRMVGKLSLFFVTASVFLIIGYEYFTSLNLACNTIAILWLFSTIILPPLAIYALRQRLGKPPEVPCENIVKEFVLAKKNKFCPMIKYVD